MQPRTEIGAPMGTLAILQSARQEHGQIPACPTKFYEKLDAWRRDQKAKSVWERGAVDVEGRTDFWPRLASCDILRGLT